MASLNKIDKDFFYQEVHKYIKDKQALELIEKAYLYAEDKHKEQIRKSGEPYFIHVLNVAYILATLRVGPSTIAAGLLHDSIEDCGITLEDLKTDFNEDIATIVESVSKIKQLKFADENEYLASNHRKIFIAMAKDIRVILVKLVDRLHNIRTLEYQNPIKQQKIARETLEVYAPIAHRLGLSAIKNELEDKCFYYLNRKKYYEIANLVEKKKVERDDHINQLIKDISTILKERNIEFRIFGRSKHLYSIHKKMSTKFKRFEEILDLQAIRIVTETEVNCYEILGYIHAKYRPIPGRLKDYIAVPKMNMYQSLHTTIVATDGDIYEIQIRTEEMDMIAENGVAAHWRYKENKTYNQKAQQKEIENKLTWFKDLATMTSDIEEDSAKEYMDVLQSDIFSANVYVMTPKGRVIDLPPGSTPIDFAYRIHTDVGHTTVGAIVNGSLVPLNTSLKTGDVVQVKTNKNSAGPSEDWLKIVKTNHAKNKIRHFHNAKEIERKSVYVSKGEALLKEELNNRNLDLALMDKDNLSKIYNEFTVSNYQDFMYAIANKALTTSAVAEKLDPSKKKPIIDFTKLFNSNKRKVKKSDIGVSVAGIDSMMMSMANCCNPIPGDDIVGYITKGSGVKIHRSDCLNIEKEKARLISAHWEDELDNNSKFECRLVIYGDDRNFLLSDLINTVSQFKAGMIGVDSNLNKEDLSVITHMTLTVNNSEHLRMVMANLKKVTSVRAVERVSN
ncbi:MAG: RelA/SpoT family protein [Erysipelotrichaceae bacterium]